MKAEVMLDHRPASLWHLIIGEYVSPIKVSPMMMLHTINAGRLTEETVNTMVSVVETSRVINRIMGRNENFGV